VRMRIGGSLSNTDDGVTLTTHYLPLGKGATLVAFRLTNSRAVGAVVGEGAALEVEGRADGRGLVISASNVLWTVLLSDSPLVRSISKYSFGAGKSQSCSFAAGSIRLAWSCSWEGIRVENGTGVSLVDSNCFSTRVRASGSDVAGTRVDRSSSLTVNDVTLTAHFIQVSYCVIFIVFKHVNEVLTD
jgi:hypothetical protein